MVKRRVPNVVRGGIAIPLKDKTNYYYMAGRKHKNGGIDIGENPRTGLEVEDGEVMHVSKDEIKVFSSVPFLNGKSPAQKVLGGENPNTVFKQQEQFKDRNGINDDGTTNKNKALFGIDVNNEDKENTKTSWLDKVKQVATNAYDRYKTFSAITENVSDAVVRNPIQQIFGNTQTNSDVGRTYNAVGARLSRIQADINRNNLPTKLGDVRPFGVDYRAIRRFNNGKYATFDKSKLADALTGGLSAWEYNNGQTSGAIQIDPDNPDKYIVKLTDAYSFDDSKQNDADAAKRSSIRGFLGKHGRKDGDPKATKQVFYYSIPRQGNDTVKAHAVYPEDYEFGNPSRKERKRIKALFETDKKYMGGLSRSKDYGSKSKPYPNVKSGDFAGGHRSYPIPTKADAIDALRLAGLHGRSDVRAKVYAKYPDLRKKSKSGGL